MLRCTSSVSEFLFGCFMQINTVSIYFLQTNMHIKHRQVRFYTLQIMALAVALIKQMLKLENRSKEACDFGRDLWIAI